MLSRGKTLARVFNLKEEIRTFLEGHGKSVSEFKDEWICEFDFLTTHLNGLNSSLQGQGQLINSTFDQVKAFKMKLRLFETQVGNKNFINFPTLKHLKCDVREF